MEKLKSFLGACIEMYEQRSFLQAYNKTFELLRADSDAQKEMVFRLRYDVFCEENKFEHPPAVGREMEYDAYDERATHYLLIHRASGDVAGTLRVILPNDDRPGESFVTQEHCTHPLLHDESKTLSLCEISRFCTAKRFRKRERDGRILSAYYDQDMVGKKQMVRRSIPYAAAALLQGAFETALSARILEGVWMVDSCHLTSLERIGFSYNVLGPHVNYHGGAQPVIFNIKNVLDMMRGRNRHCWDIVSDLGRLQKTADDLHQNDWLDSLTDDTYWDGACEQDPTDFRDLR